ncbi:hypothetical protein [Paraburkholderia fungorum]|uniref:hypothetical protein n=1 Tax=Paraburkholderia fungorum TaxID=134537 RepID=UPI0038BC5A31
MIIIPLGISMVAGMTGIHVGSAMLDLRYPDHFRFVRSTGDVTIIVTAERRKLHAVVMTRQSRQAFAEQGLCRMAGGFPNLVQMMPALMLSQFPSAKAHCGIRTPNVEVTILLE